MRLLIPLAQVERLRAELRRGGRYEIGGILMGEHVADDVFRLADLSIQRSGGSVACFVRNPADHKIQLEAFFERHGRDYSRFNYLGEWHSHPMFRPSPSDVDVETMQSIVSDPIVGANFVVLMIVRLGWRGHLELSAAAFVPHSGPLAVDVGVEGLGRSAVRETLFKRLYRFIAGGR
jgi:[CysO sulfur-carrier protein]-S-L-cysteine hydrolase